MSLRGYWSETRRPIYSAALVLPFLILYHVGTLFLRTTYINGADALIIRILSLFTVPTMFGSAIVLLVCFMVWQLNTRASWRIDSEKLWAMFLESLLYAVLLFVLFGWFFVHLSSKSPVPSAAGISSPIGIQVLILFCGAGIYEELVFRAMLLGLLIYAIGKFGHRKKLTAATSATLIASVLFSLFHYVGPMGDVFSLGSFSQRALGGIYFSALFVSRGFGIAAACHAFYDILVGLTLM